MKRRKNKLFIGVFTVLVIILWMGTFYILNKDNADKVSYKKMDLVAPSNPTVSFLVESYEVNEIYGYKDNVNIGTTRDTLTPLDANGYIHINVNDYGNDIQKISYKVLTTDGNTKLVEGVLEETKGSIALHLDVAATNTKETLLELTLLVNDEEIKYYTRIISYNKLMMGDTLEFVEEFHSATFDKEEGEIFLQDHVNNGGSESDHMEEVTEESNILTVQWGKLEPTIVSEVEWKILETTSIYSVVELNYTISLAQGDVEIYYNVSEYFRTAYSTVNSRMNLQQYRRQVNQIANVLMLEKEVGNLYVGITSEDIDVQTNDSEDIIAYVQNNELFMYHQPSKMLTKLFGFEKNDFDNMDTYDYRKTIDNHGIKILEIKDSGDLAFSVYGYMNAGEHEGEIGTIVYIYDSAQNIIIEKAFIKSELDYKIAREQLHDNISYSMDQDRIYMIANDIIYVIDLITNEQYQISQQLAKGQYMVSDEGDYIAFNSGEDKILSQVTVLNIRTGKIYDFDAPDGENIYPLGFLEKDSVLGYAKTTDELKDYRGEVITPSHKLEIRSEAGEIVKTYENEGSYVSNVMIKDKMVYLIQVKKQDGYYILGEQDYIANNLADDVKKIVYSKKVDTGLGYVGRISLFDKEKEISKYRNADLANNSERIKVRYEGDSYDSGYYVYLYGDMVASYQSAGDAISVASGSYGTVINGEQQYLWRRGDRDLTYSNSSLEYKVKEKLKEGLSVIEILNYISPTNVISYTGANLENMCYLINKGQTIGVEFENGEWGIFTGYSNEMISYVDESGSKKNINMNKLNESVKALVGTSKF